MDLKEIGWDCLDRINQAQDRDKCLAVVNAAMNMHKKKKTGDLLTS
jgi:hypothetical protein